jgi:LysR family transcriptional regulator, nitrogen assimilation regulatory protein
MTLLYLGGMSLNLGSLSVLRETIALGSMSKAAARLRIAQPHVSRLIHALEQEIGVPLLERHAKGIRPTPAGEMLAALASHLESEVAATRARIAESAPGIAGSVTLGVPGSLALPLLPGLILAARARYPGIRLRLVDGFSARLHEMTLRGQLDLALLYADRPGAAFVEQPVLAEPLGLVTSPGESSTLPIEALAVRSLALPAAPNRLRLLIDQAAGGMALNVAVELDSYPVLVRMVADGLAETILPYSAVADEVATGKLGWRKLDPLVERKIMLVRSRDRVETAAMKAITALVGEAVATKAEANRWRTLSP